MTRYRVDENRCMIPTAEKPIVQATDVISKEGDYELLIEHVLVYDEPKPKRGFAANIRVGGLSTDALLPTFGESEECYQRAVLLGLALLERKVREAHSLAVPIT